jgi:hypothetical protein
MTGPLLLRRIAALLAAVSFMCALGTTAFARDDETPGGPLAIAPGMTQTDLESVMGPPAYIQVRYMQQAWQYCPRRWMDRFRIGQWVDRGLFVTVWFRNFRVEHMRAYPSTYMGRCEDFIAAFRWEDVDGLGGFGSLGK